MKREETLKNLENLNNRLDLMSNKELYDHMMRTSPSFRETVEELDRILEEEVGNDL